MINARKLLAIRLVNVWTVVAILLLATNIPLQVAGVGFELVYVGCVLLKYDTHFTRFYNWECKQLDAMFKMFRKWDMLFRMWIKEGGEA